MTLQRAGIVPLTAVDGVRAMELFLERKDEIAAVVLDLTLPEMDGHEVSRHITRLSSFSGFKASSGRYALTCVKVRKPCSFPVSISSFRLSSSRCTLRTSAKSMDFSHAAVLEN
jgi:hypothetical protein